MQVRAAPHVLPPDLSTGKLGNAAGYLGRQNPGWAHDPVGRSLGMDKVEPQTDRCRQSPGGAAGVAGAEVRSSSARVRESRVPRCPKCAPGMWGGGLREQLQNSSPTRAQAHRDGNWGGGRSIWGRSYTATHPSPAVPAHRPSPASPAAARGSTSPERSLHRPFSTKQHYAPPTAPAPGGIRGYAQPATGRAPRPLPRPRRSRSPSPGRTQLGREMEPRLGGPARPCAATHPRTPKVTGGARTARAGRPALTTSAPGSTTTRGWGAGDRAAGTHRDVHSQRTPLLAGVFFATAPTRAGNIFLLLGVHGRASHNFNQKLIPGASFLQFGPLLPSPVPAVGLEPRALYYYPSTRRHRVGTSPGREGGAGTSGRRHWARMAVGVSAEFTCPLPPYGLSRAKSKPEAVLVLVSLRVTRGRGLPLGDKVFFLLQSEATFSTLSAPPTDSQR